MPTPQPPGGRRASRSVKLVLMGVAGAALLYSCAPGVGAGLSALPFLWFLPNPFYRPPIAQPCPPGVPNCAQQATTSSGSGSTTTGRSSTTTDTARSNPSQAAPTSSQRGGFGSSGSSGGSTGSS